MATERDYQNLYDRIAALRNTVTSRLASDLISNPQLADALTKQIDDMMQSVVDADAKAPPPPDKGLAELAGIGPQAAKDFGQTRIPPGGSSLMTRRSPPNGSSRSATYITSINTRRSVSFVSCRNCRSCSAPARCDCREATAPLHFTNSTGVKCCATLLVTGSRPTGASSIIAARRCRLAPPAPTDCPTHFLPF